MKNQSKIMFHYKSVPLSLYRVLSLTIVLLLGLSDMFTQESINTSGGNGSSSSGSVSYSIGQMFYRSYAAGTISIAEGVQQPYEISTVSSIEDK